MMLAPAARYGEDAASAHARRRGSLRPRYTFGDTGTLYAGYARRQGHTRHASRRIDEVIVIDMFTLLTDIVTLCHGRLPSCHAIRRQARIHA